MTGKFEYADKYVKRYEDVPKQLHWAILSFSSIFIEGDQRSKDAPGHGYPASNEPVIEYEVYLTEEKWKNQLALQLFEKQNVIGVKITEILGKESLKIEVSL